MQTKNKVIFMRKPLLVSLLALTTSVAYAQEATDTAATNEMPSAEQMEQVIKNVLPVQTQADNEVEITPPKDTTEEVEILPARPTLATESKPSTPEPTSIPSTQVPQPPQQPTMATTTPSRPTMPTVPRNVLKDNVPAPVSTTAVKKATNSNKGAGNQNNYSTVVEGNVLFVQPGINQIVPVAVGHLNRFITPFVEPVVTTGSQASYQVKDNVIYVGTNSQQPVTMFVTEAGSEQQAISLTLVPQQIPPREIDIRFPSGGASFGGGQVAYGSKKAEAWETSQPYVETIKNLFRALALNELPQGYQLTDIPRNIKAPTCAMPGLRIDFSRGQYLAGRNLSVFVGVVTNVSPYAVEFKENVCGDWDVAAVAAWPRNVLNSGEKTEVYVAIKQHVRTSPKVKRPSLIN